MCGFVCLWKIDDPALARQMIAKIAHRGPDELQVSRSPNVPAVMAHCRLSIIGPSAGTQPIYSAENVLVESDGSFRIGDIQMKMVVMGRIGTMGVRWHGKPPLV